MSKVIQETRLINVAIHDLYSYEPNAKVFSVFISGDNFALKASVPAKSHDTLPISIQAEPLVVSVPYGIPLKYEVTVLGVNNTFANNTIFINKTIDTTISAPNDITIRSNPSSFELLPSYPNPDIDVANYEFYISVDNLRLPAELESLLTTTTPPTHKIAFGNLLTIPCRPDDNIRVWCRAVDTAGHISQWFPNNTEGISATAPRSYIEGDSPSVIALFDYMVYGEIPVGSANGLNNMFETAYPIEVVNGVPKATVCVNGIRMNYGATNDFTYDADRKVIIFNFAPESNDVIVVDYLRSVSNS